MMDPETRDEASTESAPRDRDGRLRDLAEQAARACGVGLWGVEFRSQERPPLLRVYIDAEDGVDVDRCGAVSEQIGAMLDVDAVLDGRFVLEVSSPGIERPLFGIDQFEQYLGHRVDVRLQWAEHGRRKFRGRLISIDRDREMVEVALDDGFGYELPLDSIARAHLVADDWNALMKGDDA